MGRRTSKMEIATVPHKIEGGPIPKTGRQRRPIYPWRAGL